jgi:hypothetical protein
MRATPAPDSDLLVDALRGPSPTEAARSLAYWRDRLERLPLRRVAARREARTLIAAWEERVRRAELDRFGPGPVGRTMACVAVLRGQPAGAVFRRAFLAVVPRRVVAGLAGLMVLATLTFAVVLAEAVGRIL